MRAEELIAAWNVADVDRIVAAFGVAQRERVRLEAEALLERFPRLNLEILRTLATGNVVTTELLVRGEPDGMEQAWPGATVADYDLAGRIARYARYWDVNEFSAA